MQSSSRPVLISSWYFLGHHPVHHSDFQPLPLTALQYTESRSHLDHLMCPERSLTPSLKAITCTSTAQLDAHSCCSYPRVGELPGQWLQVDYEAYAPPVQQENRGRCVDSTTEQHWIAERAWQHLHCKLDAAAKV